MSTVFISYARENAEIALKIYRDLRRRGISAWIDTEDLLPGQRWAEIIEQQLRGCSHVLVLISNASVNKRGYVQKEVHLALETLLELPPEQTYLIPARLDDVTPVHRRLLDLHWVDLFPDYEAGFSKILRSIQVSDRTGPEIESTDSAPPPQSRDETVMHIHHVLSQTAETGLVGDNHYYITYKTRAPGVEMPDYLVEKYPDEITVVLQHQFDDLSVGDDGFAVTLSFKGVEERLWIPFDAIVTFSNPSTRLLLHL
ncbi:MAG: ClpXP protease specificity-enhancing factor SspB [Acidobacteriota bacterium]